MSKIHSISPMLLGTLTAAVAGAGIAVALFTAEVPAKREIVGAVTVVARQTANTPTWEVVVTKPRLPASCLNASGAAAARCETLMASTPESIDVRLAAPATASARADIDAASAR